MPTSGTHVTIVQRIALDPQGTISTIAGTGAKGYSGDGGPASKATFNGPKAIRCNREGNLFVVDTENHAVRRIDAATGIVDLAAHYRFADTGKAIVGRSRIRFVELDHLKQLLATANLAPVTWYGDWDRSPLTKTSREFIVVARRS